MFAAQTALTRQRRHIETGSRIHAKSLRIAKGLSHCGTGTADFLIPLTHIM